MIHIDRPGSESSQKGAKTQNQVMDQVRHVLKGFNDRLTLNNLRLAESYLKAELAILINFRVRCIDEELVACFQRPHL
jgi:hypothetical protein